ncbi:MAG: SRPBCC family protein [Sphingomicrobium sp.]|nr:SRPBCC family protein [Sphingomonadales bacterium]
MAEAQPNQPERIKERDSSIDRATAQKALLAGGIAAAAAGAAFLLARKSNATAPDGPVISDAPAWTLKKATKQADRPIAAKTLLIGRPRAELYAVWKDYRRFPDFMENVEGIEPADEGASRWTIKAPAGKTVTLVTRIREDIPDRKISWESLPESDIETSGQVEFEDAPGGRGTFVSLVMSYAPPAGRAGQLVAKLFAREPNIQARHDLRRFKQLMETGEVTTNASPSARPSESPAQPRV